MDWVQASQWGSSCPHYTYEWPLVPCGATSCNSYFHLYESQLVVPFLRAPTRTSTSCHLYPAGLGSWSYEFQLVLLRVATRTLQGGDIGLRVPTRTSTCTSRNSYFPFLRAAPHAPRGEGQGVTSSNSYLREQPLAHTSSEVGSSEFPHSSEGAHSSPLRVPRGLERHLEAHHLQEVGGGPDGLVPGEPLDQEHRPR